MNHESCCDWRVESPFVGEQTKEEEVKDWTIPKQPIGSIGEEVWKFLSLVFEAAVRRLLKPVYRGKKTETTAARAIQLGI
jgi:hypothetical protein